MTNKRIHARKVVSFSESIHEICADVKSRGFVINSIALSGIIAYNTSYGTTTLYDVANNPMGIMVDPKWEGGVYRCNSSALMDGKWTSIQLNYKRYANVTEALEDFATRVLPTMDVYPKLLKHMDSPIGDGDWRRWIEILLETYGSRSEYYIEQVKKRAALVAANRS